MPELPDLIHIRECLEPAIIGRQVRAVTIKQPIVLRNLIGESPQDVLSGLTCSALAIHGPFLNFTFDRNTNLIINLMLAGRLQWMKKADKPEGHRCLWIEFEQDGVLNICDEKKMAKVYLVRTDTIDAVPSYADQGIDILSESFTIEEFRKLAARNSRRQVRVFINDHSALSSIGNAYADEILFDARIHPKTLLARLTAHDLDRLHSSITSVMQRGIEEVRRAGRPIQEKVRDHMNVRNRHGEPCPNCGTTIRREGVRGYDVFFCPKCQPATRKLFIDWTSADKMPEES
jgi:formamidopyrimidine-DNA glycosylase